MPEKMFVVAAVGDGGSESVDATQEYHTADNEKAPNLVQLLMNYCSLTSLFSRFIFLLLESAQLKLTEDMGKNGKNGGGRLTIEDVIFVKSCSETYSVMI